MENQLLNGISMENKIKILLVEDEPIVAKVHRAMLEKSGYLVTVATNGNTAVTLAKSNLFNIIFMDIGLPDISGFDVTKNIRELHRIKNLYIPIIGLTGYVQPEYKTKGLEAGMDAVETKPIKMEELKKIVEKYLVI